MAPGRRRRVPGIDLGAAQAHGIRGLVHRLMETRERLANKRRLATMLRATGVEPRVFARLMREAGVGTLPGERRVRPLEPTKKLLVPVRIERRVYEPDWSPAWKGISPFADTAATPKIGWVPISTRGARKMLAGLTPAHSTRVRLRNYARKHAMFFMRLFLPADAARVQAMMKRAWDKGIAGERAVLVTPGPSVPDMPDVQGTLILVRRIGESLEILPKKQWKQFGVPGKLIDLVAKTQLAGIIFNHPHTGNVTRIGSRLALVDFSLAELAEVDWRSSKSIHEAFKWDYTWLSNVFGAYYSKGPRKVNEAMRQLIDRYPCSEATKSMLFKRMWIRLKRTSRQFFPGGHP